MQMRRLVNFWILLLVAAGLLLAPVASAFARTMPLTSATAMQAMSGHDDMPDHVMSGMVSDEAMSMQDMADNMPCCPDQTKSKGCDDCPFLALCMLSVSLSAPAGAMSLIAREPTTVCLTGSAPSLRIIRLEPTSDRRLTRLIADACA
jgi:hypothetical protein